VRRRFIAVCGIEDWRGVLDEHYSRVEASRSVLSA
jgi:hypothetical protein